MSTSDQAKQDTVESSSPHDQTKVTSTPSKTRIVSAKYTHSSIDGELGNDVDDYTCSKIDFPTFVKLAFGLSQAEYDTCVEEIMEWAVHQTDEYKKAANEYKNVVGERSMYEPFAKMGNMVLERAQSAHKISRKIKLIIVREKVIRDAWGTRRPDLLLVPANLYTVDDKKKTGAIEEGPAEDAQETSMAGNDIKANKKGGGATNQDAGASDPEARTAKEDSAPRKGGVATEPDRVARNKEGLVRVNLSRDVVPDQQEVDEAQASANDKGEATGGMTPVRVSFLHALLTFEFKLRQPKRASNPEAKSEQKGKGKGKRLAEDEGSGRLLKRVSNDKASHSSNDRASSSRASNERTPTSDESGGVRMASTSRGRGLLKGKMGRSFSNSKKGGGSHKASKDNLPGANVEDVFSEPKLPSTFQRIPISDPVTHPADHRSAMFYSPSDGYKVSAMHTSAGREVISMGGQDLSESGSTTLKALRTQLAGYITEVFCARGDRSFVFGARVEGRMLTLCLYHRSAIVEADSIDIIDDPVYFALLLTMFNRDLPVLGFNESMGYCDPFDLGNTATKQLGVKLDPIVGGSQHPQLDLEAIVMGNKVASPYCLIGRGTAVIAAEIAGYGPGLVVKCSWQVTSRTGEDIFILKAREADPLHTPEIFGKAVVEDKTPIQKLRKSCQKKGKCVTDAEFEVREFRILVMRRYTPIYLLKSLDDFWIVMVQLVRCVHLMYVLVELLHRDVSISNMAFYYDDDGNLVGVLLDFDLASLPPYIQASNHRTGTAPFMAREVLNMAEKYTHGLHHDLESFLYAAVWHGVGYRGYDLPENKIDVLARWRKGTWSSMLSAKTEFITKRKAMKTIIGKIQDEGLATRCNSIWTAFAEAAAENISSDVKQEKQHIRRVRALGEKAIHQPIESIPERPVSYAEWMENAGEKVVAELHCQCCNATG